MIHNLSSTQPDYTAGAREGDGESLQGADAALLRGGQLPVGADERKKRRRWRKRRRKRQ